MMSLSFVLANVARTLAAATGSADKSDELVGEPFKRRAGNGAANQRVLHHTQLHTLLARISAKLGDCFNGQPTVFSDDDGRRLSNEFAHFRNHIRLVLTIKTHGLAPLRGMHRFRNAHRFFNYRLKTLLRAVRAVQKTYTTYISL